MADVDNNHGAFSHIAVGNLVNAVLKSAANNPSAWASKMNISFDGGDTWKFLERAIHAFAHQQIKAEAEQKEF